MPTNSDMIKWAEQGRLHIKYVNVNADSAVGTDELAQFTVNDVLAPAIPGGTTTAGQGGIAIRVGQTVMISDNTAGSNLSNKAVVTEVDYQQPEHSKYLTMKPLVRL